MRPSSPASRAASIASFAVGILGCEAEASAAITGIAFGLRLDDGLFFELLEPLRLLLFILGHSGLGHDLELCRWLDLNRLGRNPAFADPVREVAHLQHELLGRLLFGRGQRSRQAFHVSFGESPNCRRRLILAGLVLAFAVALYLCTLLFHEGTELGMRALAFGVVLFLLL